MKRFAVSAFALLALMGLAGCDPAKDTEVPAAFEMPKNLQVLVFVDARPGYGVPLEVPNSISQSIVKHLTKYVPANVFMNPEVINPLKQDPVAFEGYDTMTIAQKTGADIVIVLDLWQFNVSTTAGGLTSEGNAHAFVHAVDKAGNRIFPQNSMIPMAITAVVTPAEITEQPLSAVKAKLAQTLATKVGRLFHKYSAGDKDLAVH